MSVRYFINKEKGVVVCTINPSWTEELEEVEFTNFHVYSKSTYRLNKCYKGISRCNFDEGDEFDENYGKDLAFHRAYKKYIKDKIRIIDKFIDDANNDIQIYRSKLCSSSARNNALLTELVNKLKISN